MRTLAIACMVAIAGIGGYNLRTAEAPQQPKVEAVELVYDAHMTRSAVAWTKVTIVVPAYGYFQKHGHCKTEDMVLSNVDYPDSIEFKCYHIDRW